MYPWREYNFGKIISFSLTLHTWELKVTSELGRKMILLGHPISYVIYYQLEGHLRIIFNVLLGFSISEKTKVAFFWYDTSVKTCTLDSTKFWVPIPYLENSNSSVAGEDPEGANRLFLCCEKRYFVSEMV
jgi:hypothetical protein